MNQLREIMERTDRIYAIARSDEADFKIGALKLKIYKTQLKMFENLSRMKYLSQASKFHTTLRSSILKWATLWAEEIAQVYAGFISAAGEYFYFEYTQASLNLKKDGDLEYEIMDIKVCTKQLERHIHQLEQELSHIRSKKIILERKYAHQIATHSNRVASLSLQIPIDRGLLTRLSRAIKSLMRRPIAADTHEIEWQIQNLTRSLKDRSGATQQGAANPQEALTRLEHSLKQTLDVVYPKALECRPVILQKPSKDYTPNIDFD
jgi:hypothetical protein